MTDTDIITEIAKLEAPSDKFDKSDHPYDAGYWMRYDGKSKPRQREMREGWETCDRELASEALLKATGKHKD